MRDNLPLLYYVSSLGALLMLIISQHIQMINICYHIHNVPHPSIEIIILTGFNFFSEIEFQ